MTARTRDSGFSLVELLIALTIVSLVMMALTSAFDFAQHAFARIGGATDELADIALVRRLLAEQLGQVVVAGADQGAATFSGRREGFTVTALGPRLLSAAGAIVLEVEASRDGGLVMSWHDPKSNDNRAPFRRTVALSYRVRFDYFAPKTGWGADWRAQNAEPSLVRLEFTPAGQENAALAIDIPVAVITPAVCAVRPAGKICGNG